MPKLLYVAHSFPPLGGSNSIRNYKIAKYLCHEGWNVHVLTEMLPKWKLESTLYDSNLLKEVPDVHIHRTKPRMERMLDGIPRKMGVNPRWFRAPDGCTLWAKYVYRPALKVIKEEKIDALLTTSSPTSSHLLGLWLRNKTGIPWIADFQDPWVRNYVIPFPTEWHRRREAKMEASVVANADLVSNVTRSLDMEMKEEYPDILKKKFMVVYNGFDPEVFDGLSYVRNDTFSLRYVGSLWNLDPEPVLSAIEKLKGQGAIDNRFRMEFVGGTPEKWKFLANEKELHENVFFIDHIEHQRVPSVLVSSECLLLPLYRGRGRERILGGKIGETLGSRRPMLAVANSGEFADLMREAGACAVVEPENVEEIASAIQNIFEQWKSGGIPFTPNEEVIRRFDHKNTIIPLLSQRMKELVM